MITLENVQKVIDPNLVLDIPALKVETGEIAALVGPPSSGKRVLLALLIGQMRPTAGTIHLAGIHPLDRETFSRRVGVLFAKDSLYQHRSPLENLAFHCRLYGLPKSRAEQVLDQVGLTDRATAKTESLPPGLARRLAFGRALLHQPSVLLLMDPFARCDEASISLLRRLMRQVAAEGTTILILADDAGRLAPLCDTIHLLAQGRIVESYHPEADEPSPQQPFKIPAKLADKVVLVNPADILFAEADEGRAFLQTSDARLPTQFTLTELEDRLSRSGFFRAHRGYLVNLQRVREVIPYTRNSFSLRLDDEAGTEIPLSKSSAGELRDLLGY